MAARGQLIVYEFAPGASFQGELGGALERAESGGAMRVLEAFFMQRDAETNELIVVDLRGDGAGGLIGPLLDFRLDRDARRRATERALAGGVPGVSGDALREFGNGLAPGAAIAAVLLEHVWAATLESAVTEDWWSRVRRAGFVDASRWHARRARAVDPRRRPTARSCQRESIAVFSTTEQRHAGDRKDGHA